MFYTGNNNKYLDDQYYPFYSPEWSLNCSFDMNSWETIDVRSEEATDVNQKILLDVQKPNICKSIRILIPGPDSKGREYGYIGPFEVFGIALSSNLFSCKRTQKTFLINYCFYIFISS